MLVFVEVRVAVCETVLVSDHVPVLLVVRLELGVAVGVEVVVPVMLAV